MNATNATAFSLPRSFDVAQTVAKENTRYAIASAKVAETALSPTGRAIVATDGRQLAIVPVESDSGLGMVPLGILKNAKRLGTAKVPAVISFGETNGRPSCSVSGKGETVTEEQPEDRFPSFELAVPKEPATVTIGINPQILLALAKAIGGSDGLILEIVDESHPIRVRPSDKGAEATGARGVIMPIVRG